MKIHRAYKVELDPNDKQRTAFLRAAGCARWVGSDYGHLHDREFSHMDKPEHAQTVFADADDLFTVLQAMADAEPALVSAETLEPNQEDSNAQK